jgi:hypothetical protein
MLSLVSIARVVPELMAPSGRTVFDASFCLAQLVFSQSLRNE